MGATVHYVGLALHRMGSMPRMYRPPPWASVETDLKPTHLRQRHRFRFLRPSCLKIDRRRHFESALRRQIREEERLESVLESPRKTVIEIRSLYQLDRVIEKFNNALVVLFLYSRSCGSCKLVLENFKTLCSDFHEENARVIFVKHEVHDAFDNLTDVARMHQIRSVPSFLILAGGAVMKKIQFRDSRFANVNWTKQAQSDKMQLGDAIRRILFKVGPSASP